VVQAPIDISKMTCKLRIWMKLDEVQANALVTELDNVGPYCVYFCFVALFKF